MYDINTFEHIRDLQKCKLPTFCSGTSGCDPGPQIQSRISGLSLDLHSCNDCIKMKLLILNGAVTWGQTVLPSLYHFLLKFCSLWKKVSFKSITLNIKTPGSALWESWGLKEHLVFWYILPKSVFLPFKSLLFKAITVKSCTFSCSCSLTPGIVFHIVNWPSPHSFIQLQLWLNVVLLIPTFWSPLEQMAWTLSCLASHVRAAVFYHFSEAGAG